MQSNTIFVVNVLVSAHTETFKYMFPQLFVLMTKFCFYLLIFPFKICQSKTGNLEIHTNGFQKVLCVCMHSLCILYRFLVFTRTISLKIVSQPLNLFQAIKSFNLLLYISSFVVTSWSKQSYFLSTANIPSQLKGIKVVIISVGMFIIAVMLPFYHFFYIFESFGYVTMQSTEFQTYSGRALWLWYISKNKKEIKYDDMDFVTYSITFLTILLQICTITMILFSQMLLAFVSIAILEMSNMLLKTGRDKKSSIQSLKEMYSIMKTRVSVMNKISSKLLLWTYASVMVDLSLMITDLLEAQIHKQGYDITLLFAAIFVFIIAAEAQEKGKRCKELILYRQTIDYSCLKSHVSGLHFSELAYMQATDYKLGLLGWRFFTVSYSFLGSSLSALLTFVLVAVQFKIQEK